MVYQHCSKVAYECEIFSFEGPVWVYFKFNHVPNIVIEVFTFKTVHSIFYVN